MITFYTSPDPQRGILGNVSNMTEVTSRPLNGYKIVTFTKFNVNKGLSNTGVRAFDSLQQN